MVFQGLSWRSLGWIPSLSCRDFPNMHAPYGRTAAGTKILKTHSVERKVSSVQIKKTQAIGLCCIWHVVGRERIQLPASDREIWSSDVE